MTLKTSRRAFLQGATAATAALVVGFDPAKGWSAAHGQNFVPNPFVRIAPDGTVTVVAKHFEMGQGTTTGLATLVAEELDAAWDQVTVEFAPVNTELYINTLFGVQGTGGSTAIANSWQQYREAGAAAKSLLKQAAAAEWGVPVEDVSVSGGTISAGGNSAGFGELIGKVPDGAEPQVTLKTPDQFTLIGSDKLPRKDSSGKTDGSAMFSMDTAPEGTVYAVLLRSPKFGGTLTSLDASAALEVPGVTGVKETPAGVAIYATNTWAAIKGREAVKAEWDFSSAETRSTDAMEAEYGAALDTEGLTARNDGDAAAAMDGADSIEAEFHFPFLAHAPMEPLNAVVQIKDGKAHVWDGCQFQTVNQGAVGGVTGVGAENTTIETMYAGGSFGRRANFSSDYNVENAHVAVAHGSDKPVKLVWTREDDVKGGYYRPMCVHRVKAAVDGDGNALAWHSSLATKSIFTGTPLAQYVVKDGVDQFSVEGAADSLYAIPNFKVDVRNMETPVPVLWWRSVGHSHSAYAMEVAMDMLAEKAGKDPVAFREALLQGSPRLLGVLQLAADKSGWGSDLPKGWGRGVAVHKSFNTNVAEVAEVSTDGQGRVKVERVVAAVDLGVAVNPDVIRAQVEGAIGYGLGHIMRQKITFTDGMVDQSNFPDYEPLRITDMPKVEVHIVPSAEAPTGIGEPGLPPIGPAIANAIFDATGKRITRLPMTDAGISFA